MYICSYLVPYILKAAIALYLLIQGLMRHLISSANKIASRSAMINDKSFRNVLKSRGPRIEPCGTPQ